LYVLIAKLPNQIVSPKLQLVLVIKCCQELHSTRGAINFSTPILVHENNNTAGNGDGANSIIQLNISTKLMYNARFVAGCNLSIQTSS
jgi:hypothetical protein